MIEKARSRPRLPATAWSPSFSLFLVLVPVQILVLLYLQAARRLGSGVEFLNYQWFLELWTAGGGLSRGLGFEFMKVNVLFVFHWWIVSRTMRRDRNPTHRLALLGAAVVLLGLQLLLAMSSDLARPCFTLVPLER